MKTLRSSDLIVDQISMERYMTFVPFVCVIMSSGWFRQYILSTLIRSKITQPLLLTVQSSLLSYLQIPNYCLPMPPLNHPAITNNGVVRPALVEVDLDRLRENYYLIRDKVASARATTWRSGQAPFSYEILTNISTRLPRRSNHND